MSYTKQLQLLFSDPGIPAKLPFPTFNLNPQSPVCWLGSTLLLPPGSASSSSLRMTLLLDCLGGFLGGFIFASNLARQLVLEPSGQFYSRLWKRDLASAPGSHLSESGIPSPGFCKKNTSGRTMTIKRCPVVSITWLVRPPCLNFINRKT